MLDTIGTHTHADLQDLVVGDYTAEAAWLLSTLRHHSLAEVDGGHHRLQADAPLPQWLHAALDGIDLHGPESSGEWASCFAPIDWPALVAAHPDDLRPATGLMEMNSSPDWPAICKGVDLLAQRACSPRLWVALLVAPTGELSLYPLGLSGDALDADGDADIITAVDVLLRSKRHSAEQLHVRSRTTWQLF
ncbi:hypothetical protein ACIBEH_05570 [Nocardia salmonicida]|uniref:hypothetical protein n=1 Tax=Nocardia salmonicida TaxID=53431 RepID=UPI0033DC61F7